MTAGLIGRRITVVLGIAIVLVLVAGAIRLAAAWAADAAPLTIAPASATQLAADLAQALDLGMNFRDRLHTS